MRELRMAAWLVRRVALGGRGTALPAVLLAFGMATIVLLGLMSLSAQQVAARQHQRATDATVLVEPAQSAGDSSDLRIIDPGPTNSRRWDGYDVRREYYAAGRSEVVAPGVPTMPAAGEFYASPDLIKLMGSDPVIGDLLGSVRLVGKIGSAGLVEPHELRAIVGVPSDHRLLVKVDGFGGTSPANASEGDSNTVLDLSVAAYVLALVWIPAAFFVLIVSKLAASRRERRAVSLHLIGYLRWRIRVLHFVEAALVCLPATLAACLIFWAVTKSATSVPGTTFGFYSSDAQLSLGKYVLVAALFTLVVCFAVSSDRRKIGSGRRGNARKSGQNSFARVGTASLAAGFLLLALPTVASLDGVLTPLALWVGTVLSGIGIAVAGPALVTRALAAHVGRAAAAPLVGRRMASHRVTTALRLASVMSVIIVLLLGSQSFASVLILNPWTGSCSFGGASREVPSG